MFQKCIFTVFYVKQADSVPPFLPLRPSPVTDEVLLVEETPVGAEEAVLGQGDPTTDVERLEE